MRVLSPLAVLVLTNGMIFMPDTAHAKTGPTYYTPERVTIARQNIERHDWAKQEYQRVFAGDPIRYYVGQKYASVRRYAERDDDFIWWLQPCTQIPRIWSHQDKHTCPVHGDAARQKQGFRTWVINPLTHPYQVQCQFGGEWYPSNDFLAYWKSGVAEDGIFYRERADESLLFNREHPDPTDPLHKQFVDDGRGLKHDGRDFFPLHEYTEFAYGAVTAPLLRSFAIAWQIERDPLYARKGAILLARLAFVYPDYEDALRSQWTYYAHIGGRDPNFRGKSGGMIMDLIWETFCVEAAILAYDGLYDYLDQDPELITFLREKGVPVTSGDELRRYIEDRLLRPVARAVVKENIRGNMGHHQAMALACALVLDDYDGPSPNSRDLVDFVYHGKGQAAFMLINGLHRDGGGHESPGYNKVKLDFIRVNQYMEAVRARRADLFPPDRYPDLFAGDKARAMFDYFIDVVMLNYFTPAIGDSGKITAPTRVLRTPANRDYSLVTVQNLFAFTRYGDPRYAWALGAGEALPPGELFDPYPLDELQAARVDADHVMRRQSRLLDGFGVAILEAGRGETGRAAALNYSSIIGHRQHDNLMLEFFARGLDLLPDHGYPHVWDYRWQWEANSLATNTVTVDETQPSRGIGGMARLFATSGGVHVITAQHDPYPPGYQKDTFRTRVETIVDAEKAKSAAEGVDLYERTVVMVDVSARESYLVDLFAVRGGTQHDQSWHGLLVPSEVPELDWQAQAGGTLACADVEPFTKFTDRWGRQRDDFPAFLKDIRRASASEPALWRWPSGLPEGDELRLHVVPLDGPVQTIMGRGRSPARPVDWHLDYLLVRREVKAGEPSLFLTVLESAQGEPVVRQVRLRSRSPLVLEVQRDGAVDEIHLHAPSDAGRTTAHLSRGVRVRTVQGEQVTRDVRIGNWSDAEGPGYLSGAIAQTDHAGKRIAVNTKDWPMEELTAGAAVRIFNEQRSAMFRIVSAERDGERLWLTLDQTALLAQGPVAQVQGKTLDLAVRLQFANGQITRDEYVLPPGQGSDFFAGSYLGEGASAQRVLGAAVFTAKDIPAETWDDSGQRTRLILNVIRPHKPQQIVSIWQYGIGDKVEIARVRSGD